VRILFIEPCFIHFGGYHRAINICNALASHKVKVDLLITSDKKFYPWIGKKKVNNYLTIYELPRITLNFYITGRILRGFIATIFGLTKPYDIIHAAMPSQFESNIPAFFLKLIGKKVVMDWDDICEESFVVHPFVTTYAHFCEYFFPKYLKNYCVCSTILANLALERGATNVIKIINGTGTVNYPKHGKAESIKRLSLDPNKKYLYSIGTTFAGQSRTYNFLKTFEYICQLDSSVQLLSNFDPQTVYVNEKLEGKINPEIFKNIINFGTRGYLSSDELSYYLSAADACLFLSGDDHLEKANCPLRISGYINAQKIVIVNDNNSEGSNMLKPFNCAVMDSDLQKLAKKTVKMLHNRQLQNTLIANVKIAKKELSMNHLIPKLINFYKNTK
jgi:hypothetical protein